MTKAASDGACRCSRMQHAQHCWNRALRSDAGPGSWRATLTQRQAQLVDDAPRPQSRSESSSRSTPQPAGRNSNWHKNLQKAQTQIESLCHLSALRWHGQACELTSPAQQKVRDLSNRLANFHPDDSIAKSRFSGSCQVKNGQKHVYPLRDKR